MSSREEFKKKKIVCTIHNFSIFCLFVCLTFICGRGGGAGVGGLGGGGGAMEILVESEVTLRR